ncbi:MAG: type II toxin-antitoxin system Phd/YefM family antitoxin [Alphaproteobacteria bacterium]|nr:type II toxin-antitoxin system Phd/YefM family antitoxin [Alphaproteobacteria bacterium]
MAVAAATEFCRSFASFQRIVQREFVEVQSHGETTGFFISPEAFARFQRLEAEARRAYHPSELPEHLKEAVRNAKMGIEHRHLDALLDD